MPIRYTLVALLFVSLLVSGCGNPDEKKFNDLLASQNGIGVSLGATRTEATAKVGQPFVRTSKLNGKVVEESFIPAEVKAYASDTPQLTLDYTDNALTRILNSYRPFEKDPPQPDPPFKVMVLPGVGLGSRKSDFMNKLGQPNSGALKDQWRFVGKDGRSINVQALFTNKPDSNEPLCTTLVLTLAPKVAEQRGEQYEGKGKK